MLFECGLPQLKTLTPTSAARPPDRRLDEVASPRPVRARTDVARLGRDPGAQVGQRGAGVLELASPRRPDAIGLERSEELGEDLDEVESPLPARRDVGDLVA